MRKALFFNDVPKTITSFNTKVKWCDLDTVFHTRLISKYLYPIKYGLRSGSATLGIVVVTDHTDSEHCFSYTLS